MDISRLKIWYKVIVDLICSFSKSKAQIMNANDTIEYVLQNRKSIIRFGDGEFGIYNGKDIHYQVWSKELASYFYRIKEDYEESSGKCKYILCMPYAFFKSSGWFLLKKRVYISCWSTPKQYFNKFFKQDILYGDSFLFSKDNEKQYCKLWENVSNIIFVHNDERYKEEFEKKYSKKAYFVEVPSRDAFFKVDKIIEDINECIRKNDLLPNNCLILVSAGPAGKVVAFEMSQTDFICYDTGHCWDEPLTI